MIKKLYNSIIRLAGHRLSLPILAIVSFSESIFFPIPPDVMLIPMVIAKRSKAWLYATICTIGSVFGGLAGYFIGLFFFQSIGEPLLDFFGNPIDPNWFSYSLRCLLNFDRCSGALL